MDPQEIVTTIDTFFKEGGRGVRITAELEPLAGAGAPVKSAVYSGTTTGSKAFPVHERPDPNNPGATVRCSTLLSDEASRNRAERALLDRLPDLRSITILQDPKETDRVMELPCDVLNLPHSLASTHLRMTTVGGVPFIASKLGLDLLKESGPFNAEHLYGNFPGFAISGFWFSNGQGKYPGQHPDSKVLASTRLPVVAFGINEQKRGAGAIDPTVLSTKGMKVNEPKSTDLFGVNEFDLGRSEPEAKTNLSSIGLGNIVPTMKESGWLTASSISAQGMVSYDVLRRLRFPTWSGEQVDAAHTTLALLVIASTVWSMDLLDLRAGCELTPVGEGLTINLVNRQGQSELLGVNVGELKTAVEKADAKAAGLGCPSIFGEKTEAIANEALIKAIRNGEKNADVVGDSA
jgi:hypothetical protein